MHTVDRYLLKNALYIVLLANIIALLPLGRHPFVWLNAAALGLCLLLLWLIRLTIRRYADTFGRSAGEVKDLLGRYIEDDRRGRGSFYDYLREPPAVPPNPAGRHDDST
ncbi:MAG: hypothetical protein FDZ69_08250 [Deltaproteobacteria bacterium]|nr:MAG: hypothetical protein FDZ69_08250 [Deltaproteobacteria bacterium]